MYLLIPAGGHGIRFLEPMAAARTSLGDILVTRKSASAIKAEFLEGTLDARMRHPEGAVEGFFADEAANTLAGVLGPDGLGTALVGALGAGETEADAVSEAAGVAGIGQTAGESIGLSTATQDGEGTRASALAADAVGDVEPEREVSAAPMSSELQLIIGRRLGGNSRSTGIVFEFT